MMRKFLFAILALALVLCLLPAISQPADAAGTSVQSEVHLSFKKPYVHMPIEELNPSVSDAILESVTIRNAFTEEVVTEGKFKTNVVYLIDFVIAPREGYRFNSFSALYLSGHLHKNFGPASDGKLHFQYTFTDRTNKVSNAYLNLPLLQEGMRTDELEFTYPNHKNCLLDSYKIIDLADQSEVIVLQRGKDYRLQMTFLPIDGYVVSDYFNVILNGKGNKGTCLKAGTCGEVYFDFNLDFGQIDLTNLPTDPGIGWPSTSGVRSAHPYAEVDSYPSWVDAEKKPKQGKPVGGEVYYLCVKLLTSGPVGIPEAPIVTAEGREVTVEVIDETTAKIYVRYVADREMGRVEVKTYGIEEGKPLSGVHAEVTGNAKLRKIEFVENSSILSNIEGKVFAPGKQYTVTFSIDPTSGYCGGENSVMIVDGVEYDLSKGGSKTITRTLDTRYVIDSAKATLSGMGVGKTISKVTITSGNKTLYRATIDGWASTNTSSTKFQKGHLYQLHFKLSTDNYEYRFSKNAVITIGGKEAFDLEFFYSDRTVEGVVEFSYLSEIAKVSLPAMPKTITPGTNLPTNFKVSSSAKYTMETVWLSMNTGEAVTMANKNGCYILTYGVTAKDGCEFTEDTVFYVDGKKVKPVLLTANYAQIMKPYNVGLTVVDRIELTLPEPEHGATPGEVTISADAPYAVSVVSWGVNNTGKLEDAGDTVTTFQNYKYHFLAVEMVAAPGYIFADKVTLYINGDKYTTLEDLNLGISYSTVVGFGKLGEIPKLTAPELSKDGFMLSWHGVPNADGYEVYRATSKSGKYTKVATVAETTWQDTPEQGKSYYYKVTAIFTPDTTKNSTYSNVVSIAYKCDAPSITAAPGTTGKPVISWEKVSGAKKYTVYRATSENGKYSKLGTTTKLTYTDSKAKTGTQYFYKVIANASKSTYNSGYSNIASCNVICSSVTVTVKVDAATGKPSLSWKKVDGATGYRILRQLPGEEDFTVIKEQTALAFLDTTAPIDTKCNYLVQVMGKTAALDSRMSAELSATSGIAKPVLKTSIDASGKPELRWQTVEGAVKYEIYRSTKSTKGYSLLTTVEATGYTDETVAPGKTYYYKVIAIGEVSKSAESSYVKLSGKCATPEISVSINEDSGKPTLTWEKISGAKKYTVYRATSENGKYSKLGTTTKLTYTDSKATVGKTYFYKIVANASSSSYSSSYSNIVSSVTICAKPVVKATTVAATGKPQLSWSKVTGAKEYWILLDVDGQATFLASTTKLSFIDEAAAPGETRKYAVWAINADPVCNSAMDAYTVTATCAQPKVKGAVGATGKPEITITAVEGATKYVIYRSTSKTKGYTVIDTTEGLTFTDTTAVKGKTYYYKVVAVCEDTESAQSAYAKVKSK